MLDLFVVKSRGKEPETAVVGYERQKHQWEPTEK